MNRTKEDISHKSAKGLKNSMLSQVFTTVLSFTKTFVFTLFIAPEHFGLIALSLTITGLIQLLRDFGYTSYIIQNKEFRQGELDFINTRVIALGTLAFLIVLFLTWPIAKFYNHHELYWIMPLTAIQFIFNSFTIVPMALLRRELEFGKIAKIEITSNLVSVLIGLGMLFFFRNYWVLLITAVSNFLLEIPLTFYFSKWKCRLVNPRNATLSQQSMKFGTYITVFNVVTFISFNIDRLIIGKLAGDAVLGVYSKSYDFGVSNLDRIGKPLQHVYFSALAKDTEKEKDTFFQFVYLMNSLLLLIVGPLLICLNWIITTILKPSWADMTAILPPFLLASFLAMTISLADQLLIVKSNLKRYLGFGFVKAVIATLAIVVGCFWGAKGVAWSYMIYHAIFLIPFCVSILRGSGFSSRETYECMVHLIIIVTSSILIVLVPWLMVSGGYLSIPIALAIYIFSFILLHSFVWPLMNSYKGFRDFSRILLSKRIFSGT